jgi:hypothetical protein
MRKDLDGSLVRFIKAVMFQSRCVAVSAANPPMGFGSACKSGFAERVPVWGAFRLATVEAGPRPGSGIPRKTGA